MSDTIRLIAEFFAACVGTIAFALLFQVPRKYYLYCGLAGACTAISVTSAPPEIFVAIFDILPRSRYSR